MFANHQYLDWVVDRQALLRHQMLLSCFLSSRSKSNDGDFLNNQVAAILHLGNISFVEAGNEVVIAVLILGIVLCHHYSRPLCHHYHHLDVMSNDDPSNVKVAKPEDEAALDFPAHLLQVKHNYFSMNSSIINFHISSSGRPIFTSLVYRSNMPLLTSQCFI